MVARRPPRHVRGGGSLSSRHSTIEMYERFEETWRRTAEKAQTTTVCELSGPTLRHTAPSIAPPLPLSLALALALPPPLSPPLPLLLPTPPSMSPSLYVSGDFVVEETHGARMAMMAGTQKSIISAALRACPLHAESVNRIMPGAPALQQDSDICSSRNGIGEKGKKLKELECQGTLRGVRPAVCSQDASVC